jgi:hypothetical protein
VAPISKSFFPADGETISLLLGFVTSGSILSPACSARRSSAAMPTGAGGGHGYTIFSSDQQ